MSSCSWKSETNVSNSPSLGVGKILRPLCIRENLFFEPSWLLETLTTWVTWPNTLNKAIDEIHFGHEICWFGLKIDQQTEFCTIRVVSGGRILFYVSEYQKIFILRQIVIVKTILYRLEFPKHPKSAASWPSKSPTRNNLGRACEIIVGSATSCVVTCSDLRSLHVVTYEIPCPRLVKVAVMCQKVRILSGDTWHSVVCKKKHVLELHCMLLPPEHTARRFMAPTPNISGPQNEIWSYFQKTWAPPTDLRSMRGFFFWLGTVI